MQYSLGTLVWSGVTSHHIYEYRTRNRYGSMDGLAVVMVWFSTPVSMLLLPCVLDCQTNETNETKRCSRASHTWPFAAVRYALLHQRSTWAMLCVYVCVCVCWSWHLEREKPIIYMLLGLYCDRNRTTWCIIIIRIMCEGGSHPRSGGGCSASTEPPALPMAKRRNRIFDCVCMCVFLCLWCVYVVHVIRHTGAQSECARHYYCAL